MIIPSKTTPFSHFRQKKKVKSTVSLFAKKISDQNSLYLTGTQLTVSQCCFGTARFKQRTFSGFICWLKFPIEYSFAGLWMRIIISSLYQMNLLLLQVCQNGEIGNGRLCSQSNEKFRWSENKAHAICFTNGGNCSLTVTCITG